MLQHLTTISSRLLKQLYCTQQGDNSDTAGYYNSTTAASSAVFAAQCLLGARETAAAPVLPPPQCLPSSTCGPAAHSALSKLLPHTMESKHAVMLRQSLRNATAKHANDLVSLSSEAGQSLTVCLSEPVRSSTRQGCSISILCQAGTPFRWLPAQPQRPFWGLAAPWGSCPRPWPSAACTSGSHLPSAPSIQQLSQECGYGSDAAGQMCSELQNCSVLQGQHLQKLPLQTDTLHGLSASGPAVQDTPVP